MKVFRIYSNIRLVVVVDDEVPDAFWLKRELEMLQGVAAANADTFDTEQIPCVSLGPTKNKDRSG